MPKGRGRKGRGRGKQQLATAPQPSETNDKQEIEEEKSSRLNGDRFVDAEVDDEEFVKTGGAPRALAASSEKGIADPNSNGSKTCVKEQAQAQSSLEESASVIEQVTHQLESVSLDAKKVKEVDDVKPATPPVGLTQSINSKPSQQRSAQSAALPVIKMGTSSGSTKLRSGGGKKLPFYCLVIAERTRNCLLFNQ